MVFTQIKVTDGKHSNITNVTISILDVNDHFPKFTEEVYSFNVSEVSFCGTELTCAYTYRDGIILFFAFSKGSRGLF